MVYKFRKAVGDDLNSIFQLYKDRIDWMNQLNLNQWNKTNYLDVYGINYFHTQMNKSNLYVAEDTINNTIVGAVILLNEDDMWENNAHLKSYYIHNLVTSPNIKGIGIFIFNAIEVLAKNNGIETLRLDCAEDNYFLNQYYESKGYIAVDKCKDGLYYGIKREKILLSKSAKILHDYK